MKRKRKRKRKRKKARERERERERERKRKREREITQVSLIPVGSMKMRCRSVKHKVPVMYSRDL